MTESGTVGKLSIPENRTDTGNGSDRFAVLEKLLIRATEISSHIAKKHWQEAEREQYPFWIGIIIIAILGIAGMYTRDVRRVGLLIAIVMLVGLVLLVVYYLRNLSGRFLRQWTALSADGELFKFLNDTAVLLGYPVEFGRPDEVFETHLDIPYREALDTIEKCLRQFILVEIPSSIVPPGIYLNQNAFEQNLSSATHRVFEAEYRGIISRMLSIRVSASSAGCDITIGFPVQAQNAETRERMIKALADRLHNRIIAACLLAEIRKITGVPPEPIPAIAQEQFPSGAGLTRAV